MTNLVSILDKLKKSSANIVSIGRIFFAFIAIYLVIAYQIDESTSLFVTKAMKETSGNAYYWAIICTILAFALDGLDGYLARKNNQVTDFGKFIDAIADKVLVNSVLIIFAGLGLIDTIIPVIVVVRDVVVDAIRMLASNKGKVQAARMLGKIKAACLMIGIVLTFFYNLPFEIWGIKVSDFFLYFGTIMSLISMCEYYSLNKKIIFSEFEKN